MKKWTQNFLLIFGSIAFILIILEWVILKFFIITTDVARVEFKDKIIRYKSNQQGVTKLSNEYSSAFSINQDGWNSHHKKYSIDKRKKTRVAVIGDSYIAALEPGYKNAIPFLLEEALGANKYEVYNFSIGGAHLAQYLHMFRKEVIKYDPSLIIFLIIHNDFAPSYKKDLSASGRYGGTFLKLPISEDGKVTEIAPQPYEPKWDTILDFRLIRFLFYQHKLRTRISYIKDLILNKQYEMNIETSNFMGNLDRDKVLANYVVTNVMNIAHKKGIEILFIMNGDTQSIYNSKLNGEDSTPIKLNKMMKKVTEENGAHFINLHHTFKNDYANNHKFFEFKTDGHWSPYGQAVAVAPLAKKTMAILSK